MFEALKYLLPFIVGALVTEFLVRRFGAAALTPWFLGTPLVLAGLAFLGAAGFFLYSLPLTARSLVIAGGLAGAGALGLKVAGNLVVRRKESYLFTPLELRVAGVVALVAAGLGGVLAAAIEGVAFASVLFVVFAVGFGLASLSLAKRRARQERVRSLGPPRS